MDAPNVSGRLVRVNIEAQDFSCDAFVNIPGNGGYRSRLSDMMNGGSEFVSLVEASVSVRGPDGMGQEPVKYDTILLRKGEIKYMVPME